MKSPFPGMDPYLEKHWGDIHARLIIYACDQLQAALPRTLFARVEERVYLEMAEGQERSMYPDVRVVEFAGPSGMSGAQGAGTALAEPIIIPCPSEPMTETFLEILDAESGKRVVTVIEVLSLSNKRPGEGQELHLRKQKECQQARVNLVEIDLLRGGQRLLSLPLERIPPDARTTYQACAWRVGTPPVCEIYPMPLRRRLPTIRIPLRATDKDVDLDLQALVDQAYANGRYARTIDYKIPPDPPLSGEDASWAEELLVELRKSP